MKATPDMGLLLFVLSPIGAPEIHCTESPRGSHHRAAASGSARWTLAAWPSPSASPGEDEWSRRDAMKSQKKRHLASLLRRLLVYSMCLA